VISPDNIGQDFVELLRALIRDEVLALLPHAETDRDAWPEWMSVETAARYLDVSPERVRKLQARGEIPYYQEAPGCRVMFNRRELNAWMQAFRRVHGVHWEGTDLSGRAPRQRPRPGTGGVISHAGQG
jgi:excisionase family DNA binding protein